MVLSDLYHELHGLEAKITKSNLKTLAENLSKIARRESPWTWRYLNNIINGRKGFRITGELERAINIKLAMLDGQSETQARAREIAVLTTNGIVPKSLIPDTMHSKPCQTCGMMFIGYRHQKYHSPKCRRRFYRTTRPASP